MILRAVEDHHKKKAYRAQLDSERAFAAAAAKQQQQEEQQQQQTLQQQQQQQQLSSQQQQQQQGGVGGGGGGGGGGNAWSQRDVVAEAQRRMDEMQRAQRQAAQEEPERLRHEIQMVAPESSTFLDKQRTKFGGGADDNNRSVSPILRRPLGESNHANAQLEQQQQQYQNQYQNQQQNQYQNQYQNQQQGGGLDTKRSGFRGGGIGTGQAYTQNQNNSILGRRSTRVAAPPGGHSSFSLAG
jgi:hypothetical protein